MAAPASPSFLAGVGGENIGKGHLAGRFGACFRICLLFGKHSNAVIRLIRCGKKTTLTRLIQFAKTSPSSKDIFYCRRGEPLGSPHLNEPMGD